MVLQGYGVSTGIATGQVVISTTGSSFTDTPCILVTDSFTPDMVVKFKNLLGIVTEKGGFTSHAAIIARTMCIPCITNVKDATHLLDNSQKVTIESRRLMELATIEVIDYDE